MREEQNNFRNPEELKALIREAEATLAVFQDGLRAAMATLRSEPLEIDVEVFHANVTTTVRKPHPALRRLREISTSMRALELRLKKFREVEKSLEAEKKLETSHWAQFAPKDKANGRSNSAA